MIKAILAWILSLFKKNSPGKVLPFPGIENVSPVKLNKIPPYLDLALKCVGKCEGKDDAWIVSLFKSTTYHTNSSATAWCAAFICYLMDSCKMRSTRSAAALSQSKLGIVCPDNEPGAVMVWEHLTGPLKGHFHTNMLIEKIGDEFHCVGGNQGNAVTRAVYGLPNYRLISSRKPVKL
jgi:hypothetical protein